MKEIKKKIKFCRMDYEYIPSTKCFIINGKYTIYHNGTILNKKANNYNIPDYVILIRDCLMRQRQEIKEGL